MNEAAAGVPNTRRTKEESESPKRLLQISPQVPHILDAHGKSQQPVREPHRQPLLPRYGSVRHRRRMAHQALDPAQALGAREQLEAIEHRPARIERAVARDERDHATEPARLPLREVVLRVIRSEEHTSELQSRDDISYAVFCLQ